MIRLLASCLLGCALSACASTNPSALGSTAEPSAAVELQPPLLPLARLAGEWEGEAEVLMPTGRRITLRQHERVVPRLGGAVLVVEGTGRGESGEVEFNALGVFSVDAATGTVYLDAFTREGRHTRVAPTLLDDGFDWQVTPEAGPRLRYQMRFDDAGRWVETGEVSLDGGATWLPTFSMTLTRVGP